ncbi:MAG: OmpA/MotB domain protein [Deltaproteobacteria bacterium]|nr:OmpA/MotB domain protein [Deltaproteobacteria bacterium]
MIVVVRGGMLVAMASIAAIVPSPLRAEPRLEGSGFVGVGYFSHDTELGNSWAPEQVPNSAPVVGARLGYLIAPALAHIGARDLQLAVEGELALATAFTGTESHRRSYFAPVFGWRAHGLLQLAGGQLRPHLVVGAGGETVTSSSPFMAKETDPVVYWGLGGALQLSGRWQLRGDIRHGLMPARASGVSSTLELQLGLATTFGPKARRHRADPSMSTVATNTGAAVDNHGSPPAEPTGDAGPRPDPDGDGIVGAADACPETAEDADGFEDTDGCPELDNDHDGVLDARDGCPLQPETVNGIADEDGCPDGIPDDVTQALVAATAVRFEPGRARVTLAARVVLRSLLAMLGNHPEIRIAIAGRPDKAGADELARRRVEAVKWYLVDQGIIADRITTKLGTAGSPVLELTLEVTPR